MGHKNSKNKKINNCNSNELKKIYKDDKKSNVERKYTKNKNNYSENKNIDIDLNDSYKDLPVNFKQFKIIASDANDNQFESSFLTFKSNNNILFLIYSDEVHSIFCYNLINFQLINKISKAHDSYIVNLKHFYDKNNARDLILSASSGDNNIKLWQFENWLCLHNFIDINCFDFLFAACFLNYKNQIYILSSNYSNDNTSEPIKVFDLEGHKIQEVKNSKEQVFHIDTFYDEKLLTDYIVTSNENRVISYNFNKNDIYFKYEDREDDRKISHYSFIVKEINKLVNIIESGWDGYIRVWEFHSGKLLKKIKILDTYLNGINLLDNKYLLVGCKNNKILIVDLNNSKVINELFGHIKDVIGIKTIDHIKYGKCLVSKGYEGQIIFWISSNISQ